MDAHLHAVDADTGELCAEFGEGGVLDVNQWNDVNAVFPLLAPPAAHGGRRHDPDRLVRQGLGRDGDSARQPHGRGRADGRAPVGHGFIPEELIPVTGTANIWSSMSADPELGLVFVPISSPEPNYWGGNRLEGVPLATSITAVDIATGRDRLELSSTRSTTSGTTTRRRRPRWWS
jgi:quinoprotein glucose dehydrogenase